MDSAPAELAVAGFREAADFADVAEEISRRVEQLQLLSAAAVDRTRTTAINAAGPASKATGWTTGWGTEPAAPEPSAPVPSAPGPAVSAGPVFDPADDGCRNTAEFLKTRLRIGAAEARRRLALASAVLPRTGITGEPMPPACEETAAALADGTIASRAGTTITTALDRVRHIAPAETLARMEHALTSTAAENDHDFLTRIAHRWADAIDQDGTEPSEEELRHRQGAFLRRPRRGLHHLEIFATTDQYEHLLTVMNTATNPRTGTGTFRGTGTAADPETGGEGGQDTNGERDPVAAPAVEHGTYTGPGFDAAAETAAADAHLERRTRPQQHLDGLVGACKTALATATLPATGGLRPQVMVTISYQDLLTQLETAAATGPRYPRTTPTTPTATARTAPGQPHHRDASHGASPVAAPGAAAMDQPPSPGTGEFPGTASDPDRAARTGQPPFPGTAPGTDQPLLPGTATGTGTFIFTGPVTPAIIRKIACDADIIPVLFGSEGRILDIGRTTRIFPPHIRKALTARDQGCAFPNCTIPAPWCEAHHTTYWSHGGPTNTDNGVLLCSHHHHLIHKEQWTIHMRSGVPWFIPPPHIDPRQKPRRNHHHRT
ncbi:hypothetical protein J2809_002435 [Arthrobacter pascens]|uniref:HNH endonuclease signature motif containing protein n=1 Tax=Arthrobacter pascens TaxID=1677 RepID=UPI00285E7FE8|nr:DUF222 domain-containing protein [Arthrobacter pascens]MDR6558075.1 hypothetical protein [Arthrobacter pascens]